MGERYSWIATKSRICHRASHFHMPNSVTYDKLKQIGEEIAQIKDHREFGRRLKFEFMDFIEGHPKLRKEYLRRTGFYENLPSTLEFQSLLNSIHDGFKELHKRIIEKKLPPQLIFVNQARATPEERSRLTMHDIYVMLSSRKPWPKFDEMDSTAGVYVSGGLSPPWDRILRQYELIRPFIMEAENAGAVRGGQETTDIALQTMADIQSLRELITTPLLRWHLHAFYHVKFYGQEPDFITSVDTLSKSVSRVCSELLFHLKELEEQRKIETGNFSGW